MIFGHETRGRDLRELEKTEQLRPVKNRRFGALVAQVCRTLCQGLILIFQPDHVRYAPQARLSSRIHVNPLFPSPVGRSRLATRRILAALTRKLSPSFMQKEFL